MFPYYFIPAVGILQPASVIGISSITENPFPHGPVSMGPRSPLEDFTQMCSNTELNHMP